MAEVGTIAQLRKAYHYSMVLHELELQSRRGTRPSRPTHRDLEKEWPQIASAQAWCAAQAATDVRAAIMCSKLAGVAGTLLDGVKGRATLIRWRTEAVAGAERALARSDLPDDPSMDMVHDLLGHLTYLAYLHFTNRNPERGRRLLERARELVELPAGQSAESAVYAHLGMIALGEEAWDEAETHLNRALAASERDDDPARGESSASIHNTLGVLFSRRGLDERAAEHHKKSLECHERVGNRSGMCTALINLASTLRKLGRDDDARRALSQAGDIVGELGDSAPKGLYKSNLALFYSADPDPARRSQSVELLEEARAEFARTGDRMQEARVIESLEGLYCKMLAAENPRPTYEQRSHVLRRLAVFAQGRSDHATTIGHMEALLRAAEVEGNRLDQLEALAQIGHTAGLAGDLRRAAECHGQALDILAELRGRDGPTAHLPAEREILLSSGQVFRQLGDPDEAARRYERAVDISMHLGDEDAERRARGNLALVNVDRARFDEAIPALRELVEALRSGDDHRMFGLARFNLAYALHRSRVTSTARREAEEALRLLELTNAPEADEVRRQVAEWEPENNEEQ